jgi:hypothetical protein
MVLWKIYSWSTIDCRFGSSDFLCFQLFCHMFNLAKGKPEPFSNRDLLCCLKFLNFLRLMT